MCLSDKARVPALHFLNYTAKGTYLQQTPTVSGDHLNAELSWQGWAQPSFVFVALQVKCQGQGSSVLMWLKPH